MALGKSLAMALGKSLAMSFGKMALGKIAFGKSLAIARSE
jgi:hypothetical protein